MKVKLQNEELEVRRVVQFPDKNLCRAFVEGHGMVEWKGSIFDQTEAQIKKKIIEALKKQ